MFDEENFFSASRKSILANSSLVIKSSLTRSNKFIGKIQRRSARVKSQMERENQFYRKFISDKVIKELSLQSRDMDSPAVLKVLCKKLPH